MITMQSHGGADSDRHASHGSNHRLLRGYQRLQEKNRWTRLSRFGIGKVHQIISCSETDLGSRDQYYAHVRVGIGLFKGFNHAHVHAAGQSILLFWTVEP